MDVFIGVVKLLVSKIGMGEGKKRNRIGTSLHNFHVFLQQNNPLKFVVIWMVRVIIENWLARVNKL